MTPLALKRLIKQKENFLCVGLDTDVEKLPRVLKKEANPALTFNKAIIDATRPYCVSYKINTAFYEAMGAKGWDIMAETLDYIGDEHFVIADAKRGDIGNTAQQYAIAFFEKMNFHAITLSPYMGVETVEPYLKYPNKWAIILGLTSNEGAADLQLQKMESGMALFEKCMTRFSDVYSHENTMFVVGATKASFFRRIRQICPDHFLLVPGVGTQGGSLEEICQYGLNNEVGLLVNVSRGIIYAGGDKPDFAKQAGQAAAFYKTKMGMLLRKKRII